MLKNLWKEFFQTNTHNSVGLSITKTQLQILQINSEESGDLLQIFHIAALPQILQNNNWYHHPQELGDFLLAQCNLVGITAQDIYLVLNCELFYLQKLHLPFLKDNELCEAVKWEALQYVPFEENCYYYDFIAHEQNSLHTAKSLDVLLVAIAKAPIDVLAQVMQSISKKIINITVDFLALYNYIDDGEFFLLNAQGDSSQIHYFQNKTWKKQQQLNLLVDNPLLSIAAFIEHTIPNQTALNLPLYIAGDISNLNNTEFISEQLEIPVQLLDPWQQITISNSIRMKSIQTMDLIQPLGAVINTEQPQINLLPSNLRASSLRISKTLTACILISVLSLAVVGIYEYSTYKIAQNKYNTIINEDDTLQQRRKRYAQISALQADFDKRSNLIRGISTTPSWYDIIKALGYTTPHGVELISFTRNANNNTMLIRGNTTDISLVTTFVKNLEKTGAFTNVQPEQMGQLTESSNVQSFSISLQVEGMNNAITKK